MLRLLAHVDRCSSRADDPLSGAKLQDASDLPSGADGPVKVSTFWTVGLEYSVRSDEL